MATRNGKRINEYVGNDNEEAGAVAESESPTLEQIHPQPAKKAKKTPKIFDGKFYVIENETNGNIQAKCTACGDVRKGNVSSTGNFISHYKKKHPLKLGELKANLKGDNEDGHSNTKSYQPTLSDVMKSITPETVSSKILNFIIDGNLSINVAQLPSLRDLLETVSGRKIIIPSRHKFVKTLDMEFNEMKTMLKDILSQQKYLCITADVWSSRAQSYLGVTVHFLNRETFKRESFVLAFKQLYLRQTYKELAKAMDDIFNDFEIKKSQITNIVTDGGSAFCKMFKIYGSSIDAAVSTYSDTFDLDESTDLNLEDLDDANVRDVNVVTLFMEDLNGEQFINDVLEFGSNERDDVVREIDESVGANSENFLDSYFGENVIPQTSDQIEMPPQRRCISHLLHLTSQDFENKFLTGLAKKSLCQSLSKLHSLFVLTRRSSRAKTICKAVLGQCLKIPCETRWNSRYDAVKMCTRPEIHGNLNKLIQELKTEIGQSAQNLQLLTNTDFAVINQYVKVLEPVAISLDVMQREFNSSQGFIVPVLSSMKHRITLIEEHSNIARDFKNAMIKAIDSRFLKYFMFDNTNTDLLLASITMPRIKTNFIEEDDNIIYVKRLLITECKKMKNDNCDIDNVHQIEIGRDSDDDFIISFASRRDIRRNSLESEIEAEASRFLCDSRTDLTILNEFPSVREVFFKYNTTLASSAPVERVFSQSLMIFTPRRNRLSANIFEQTLLLKHNRILFKN